MKLWLDDVRPAPDATWTACKTAATALEYLKTGAVTVASLDHDLGGAPSKLYNWLEPNGSMLAQQMVQDQAFPTDQLIIHSSNTRGAKIMEQILQPHLRYTIVLAPLPPA